MQFERLALTLFALIRALTMLVATSAGCWPLVGPRAAFLSTRVHLSRWSPSLTVTELIIMEKMDWGMPPK